jgi:hypothetical protein
LAGNEDIAKLNSLLAFVLDCDLPLAFFLLPICGNNRGIKLHVPIQIPLLSGPLDIVLD